MPRKVFVAGEILTASDVNTNLMDQSVMVFDDATDRATAIPTPVEGMVTYLKDTNQVQAFTGAAFTAVGGILQVLSAIKTDVFTTSSLTFTPVTGLAVTITPSSASSKVLILAQISIGRGSQLRITGGNSGTFIGDAAGTRTRVTLTGPGLSVVSENAKAHGAYSVVFLDSPATTSAVTYQFDIRFANTGSGDTAQINKSTNDPDEPIHARSASSVIAMEVAG